MPYELAGPEHAGALLRVASDSFALTIFRAETLSVYDAFDKVFGSLKDPKRVAKQKAAVLDAVANSVNAAPEMHRARRVYLRQQLRQLAAIMADKPGLLAPRAAMVLTGLAMAADEAAWLLRHTTTPPPKAKGHKLHAQALKDPEMPELFFHMMSLKALYATHADIVQRYFTEYLTGFDISAAQEACAGVRLPQQEDTLLGACVSGPDALRQGGAVSFEGLRLDWLRLQAALSMPNSPAPLLSNQRLATALNNIDYHTRFVDTLGDLVRQASAPAGLYYYKRTFLGMFEQCLETPGQERCVPAAARPPLRDAPPPPARPFSRCAAGLTPRPRASRFAPGPLSRRYAVAFPLLCDGFGCRGSSSFVPAEKLETGRESANTANSMLNRMANQA